MLLSLRKNGLTSLFKEVRAFKVAILETTCSGTPCFERPERWDDSQVGFQGLGALCFCQAHFGRTMFPKWPFFEGS